MYNFQFLIDGVHILYNIFYNKIYSCYYVILQTQLLYSQHKKHRYKYKIHILHI